MSQLPQDVEHYPVDLLYSKLDEICNNSLDYAKTLDMFLANGWTIEVIAEDVRDEEGKRKIIGLSAHYFPLYKEEGPTLKSIIFY